MATSTPPAQSAAMQTLDNYTFPQYRLRLQQQDPSRTPLILVACGSFSPITYLHLRMFVLGRDFARFNTNFEVMGGYISPVSDAYKKAGLAEARHRLAMCELGANENASHSGWLMVDPWEAIQSEYKPTAQVLDHFAHEINTVLGGAQRPDGSRVPMRIMLLAGADLIGTMSSPGVWSEEDLTHILGQYGAFVVERSGTDLDEALVGLERWKQNIYRCAQLIQNDVSSTKIRLFLRRDMSVQYLIPGRVIEYIEENGLYEEPARESNQAESSRSQQPSTSNGEGSSSTSKG